MTKFRIADTASSATDSSTTTTDNSLGLKPPATTASDGDHEEERKHSYPRSRNVVPTSQQLTVNFVEKNWGSLLKIKEQF